MNRKILEKIIIISGIICIFLSISIFILYGFYVNYKTYKECQKEYFNTIDDINKYIKDIISMYNKSLIKTNNIESTKIKKLKENTIIELEKILLDLKNYKPNILNNNKTLKIIALSTIKAGNLYDNFWENINK